MKFPEWIVDAERLYKENKSFTLIGKELGVCRKSVSYYLQKKGYEPNHKYIPKNKVKQKTQKNIDENIFEIIDNEAKAYWLGCLMADGSVSEKNNSVELALKEEDYNHIEKYKTFLKSDHKINIKVKDGIYVSYKLGFRNEKIKNDLIKHGCIPNKTKNMEFPEISRDLIHHFIRGYFDGDGYVGSHSTAKISIEILGHDIFLREIAKFFNIEGHIYGFNHSSISRFMIAGEKANKIMECLYKDATIYLERKREKYEKLAVLFQPSQKE